jgi:hypothetical protein
VLIAINTDAPEPLFDHAIDGVDAATADSDDLDNRQIVLRCCHEEGTFPLVLILPSRRVLIPADHGPWAWETLALPDDPEFTAKAMVRHHQVSPSG